MVIINWFKVVVLKKYADFSGRASRPEFWYFILANAVIAFVLGLIKIGGTPWFAVVYNLAVLIPSTAVGVRRLHDINKSGWSLLIALIPFVGAIILLIWCAKEGDAADNNFGAVPSKEPEE